MKKTPISDEFIDWLMDLVDDEKRFHKEKVEAKNRMANALSPSLDDLLSVIIPRVVFGRDHYGDAIFKKGVEYLAVQEREENIDALIYYLMAVFLKTYERKTRE